MIQSYQMSLIKFVISNYDSCQKKMSHMNIISYYFLHFIRVYSIDSVDIQFMHHMTFDKTKLIYNGDFKRS